mmetsp:Transcript_630/g.1222  ORF Transcript_630/g.1222 Transcript_630/m.1222 type:complete len:440 (+) Transcript_630:106-1425(+)
MVPRTSSLQGQVVTYHGGDDGSMSSYTEIDEIITVSSYETIEKPRRQGRSSATNDGNEHNNQDVADDDDDEASYETITVVLSESEYETEREEIIVSDYVTDSEYEDHEEEAPVPRPLSPKKGASPTAKRAKSPSTKKKQSKTTQPTSNLVKAKTTGTDSPKRKKNGSPKKTSSPKKGFPLVGASKRRAKPMNRDDNGDDDTPKEKDDDDDDDNEQDPNDADDEDSDEEALSDKDIKGNHSHVASDTEDDDDDDDDDCSVSSSVSEASFGSAGGSSVSSVQSTRSICLGRKNVASIPIHVATTWDTVKQKEGYASDLTESLLCEMMRLGPSERNVRREVLGSTNIKSFRSSEFDKLARKIADSIDYLVNLLASPDMDDCDVLSIADELRGLGIQQLQLFCSALTFALEELLKGEDEFPEDARNAWDQAFESFGAKMTEGA